MATDTARVQLELASGRSEITAPFHQTAERRRKEPEQAAGSVGAPVDELGPTQVVVPIPLAGPAQLDEEPTLQRAPTGTVRPPWIAFIAAVIAVGVAVWWVMSQRMPSIDPGEVIARNLNDAAAAMAEGRYTDPPERSAFHYYNTVLALDPKNTDAIAGIDAIADRHLTNARVLLSGEKIAEAGIALEKARRVRPEHEGLAALDKQWRGALRKLLVPPIAVAKPIDLPPTKPAVAQTPRPAPKVAVASAAPKVEQRPAPTGPDVNTVPDVNNESVAQARVADLSAATATLSASTPSAPSNPIATELPPPVAVEPAEAPPAAVAASAEPKLIKMVHPEYPQEAAMRGLEGWVDVSMQVSASGDVIALRVEESSRGRLFNRAALNAVQQWKYEPRSDGTTSERLRVRVRFKQSN
jgi:TonB family protein